jgi:hypothetical protein
MPDRAPRRAVISEAHVALGSELRRARLAAGKTTRDMDGYSSGHISNVENGHVTPSPELVRAYIAIGGDSASIMSCYDDVKQDGVQRARRRRQAQRPVAPVEDEPITPDSPAEVIRGSYRLHSLDVAFQLDARGAVTAITMINKIQALETPVRYILQTAGYGADPRRGVLSFEPGANCEIAKVVEYDSGLLDVTLSLNEPAMPGDSALTEFAFTVRTQTDKRANPYLRFYTHNLQHHHAVRVQFTPGALPKDIWWFRGRSHLDVETAVKHQLAQNEANFYFCEFLNLRDEYFGVAWEWEESA